MMREPGRIIGGSCRLLIGICLGLAAKAEGQVLSGSSEGLVFSKGWAAISYNVDHVCPSRSSEAWYSTLLVGGQIVEPTRMRPEGIVFRNGQLYISGDWGDTQNQIAVLNTNYWGDLTFNRVIRIPISSPPPTTTPNNQWWGPEGMTFNTGVTGVGANAAGLITVDNLQQGVGNTIAVVDTTTGVLSNFGVVTYPEDIAYAPASQRFYVMYRTPNQIQAFDANMAAVPISWSLPTRTRGMTVVSAAFGQFLTGDNTLTGDIIVAVSMENTTVVPAVTNRLSVYKADGTPVGVEQDMSWVDLSLDNSGGGGTPGPHQHQGVAVDEASKTIYIVDDAARCVYVLKPLTAQTATASGAVFSRTWQARGNFVRSVLPSRSSEAWYPNYSAQVLNPPSLDPEGLVFRNGQLYASGDWSETQNQIAVFNAAADGTLTFNRSIAMPVPLTPPAFPNNQLWGPEGLTFNTAETGYGSGGATLITTETGQFLAGGNTRALIDPITAILSGLGKWTSAVGSVEPEDITYAPVANRFYVVDHGDVVQAWNIVDPPTYADSQFATLARPRGICAVSPAFAQYLLSNPTITSEVLLVAFTSDAFSLSAPHNRLAAYSLTGSLLAQQDMLWTRDALPGQFLQTFSAIAVDEANKVIYLGDEKGNAIFALTVPQPLSIATLSPLPNGAFGTLYNQPITATGGTPPYTFSVLSGSLPSNVTLGSNGALTGTPGACGHFNFTAQVIDGASNTSAKPFAMTINYTGLVGDLDGNDVRDSRDISFFVRAETGFGSGAEVCAADMNGDFVIDSADELSFVTALLGP